MVDSLHSILEPKNYKCMPVPDEYNKYTQRCFFKHYPPIQALEFPDMLTVSMCLTVPTYRNKKNLLEE